MSVCWCQQLSHVSAQPTTSALWLCSRRVISVPRTASSGWPQALRCQEDPRTAWSGWSQALSRQEDPTTAWSGRPQALRRQEDPRTASSGWPKAPRREDAILTEWREEVNTAKEIDSQSSKSISCLFLEYEFKLLILRIVMIEILSFYIATSVISPIAYSCSHCSPLDTKSVKIIKLQNMVIK